MKLEVGKIYKTRLGHEREIISSFRSLSGELCFKDSKNTVYGEDGKIIPLLNCPEDLIREIVFAN